MSTRMFWVLLAELHFSSSKSKVFQNLTIKSIHRLSKYVPSCHIELGVGRGRVREKCWGKALLVLIEHSCFPMLCQFLPYSKVNSPTRNCLRFWIIFPFRSPRAPSRVPRAIQPHQLSRFIHSSVYKHMSIPPPSMPLPTSLLVSTHLFLSLCLYFCFCQQVHLYHFF